MLFYLVILPLEVSLTAAQLYPGLNDYGLLRSHVWKYPHQHHQPPALYYKGVPISENAYGYYPPFWNVQTSHPYNPKGRLPKPDHEKDLHSHEDTRDIRGQGGFCQFFDESAGNRKQYTGNVRPRSSFTEYDENVRPSRVKVSGEPSNEGFDNRRHHADTHIRSGDEDDEDFRVGRVKMGKDMPVAHRQEEVQSAPFRPRTSEDLPYEPMNS